jgi:hypothetical protein
MSNLRVTPEIDVPSARLPTQPLARVMTDLALAESSKGLIDEGGTFVFN